MKPAQLSMFEPEGQEAMDLLAKKLAEADKAVAQAERFDMLGMTGAGHCARRLAAQAQTDALVFAILLDIEREAGL